jgi:hypothetical protein
VVAVSLKSWGPYGGVVFGCDGHGFTLRGSDTGIDAHHSDYVYIHQNQVEVHDEGAGFAMGISVMECKAPIIDDNVVKIASENDPVEQGIGIDVFDCAPSPYGGGAEVTSNTVDVHATCVGEGINVDDSPKALVYDNDVDVTVMGSTLAWGIKLTGDSELSQITWNNVTVHVEGDVAGAGFGIKVLGADRVTVAHNAVDVYVSIRSGCLGGNLAVGILMLDSWKSAVNNNTVTVLGEGDADSHVGDAAVEGGIAALDLTADQLAALEDVIAAPTGKGSIALSLAGGLVLGIIAIDCDNVDVTGNGVNADADIVLRASAADSIAIGGGAVLSVGITALCGTAPLVAGNGVTVDADSDIHVLALHEVTDGAAIGLGGGLAAGLGIVVGFGYPDGHGRVAVVSSNQVEAHGDVVALVEAKNVINPSAGSVDDSVVGKLQSEVLSVVYDIITDSVENEEVDVQISGNPMSLWSLSAGGALGLGIGITTLWSPAAQITGNDPVIGAGTVDVTISAWDEINVDTAVSLAGGLALGIGVLDAWCTPTNVSANNNVSGSGDTNVDASAAEISNPDLSLALAAAGGGGVGLGVLVIGGLSQTEAAAEVEEQDIPTPGAVVAQNIVAGEGNSTVVTQAINRDPHTGAVALGSALAAGKGIVVVGVMFPVIMGNGVTALADACANTYAAAISTVDPLAMGSSAAIAVGIIASGSCYAQITDNTVTAYGDADGMTTAIEQMVMDQLIAEADGTSKGVGIGIIVANSNFTRVSRNHSTGDGTATAIVNADQREPLDEAWAWALGIGIGKGIVVAHVFKAWVQESNTFIGNGHATVDASAAGDWAHAAGLGLALGIDECAIDGGYVAFNYNDMPMLGGSTGSGPVTVIDLGLLAVFEGHVDARYQWWGSESGPTTGAMVFVPPFGQPMVAAAVCYTEYVPWLWAEHAWSLDTHIGKYGKYICLDESRNYFSTPITLAAHADEWTEIVALSGITGGVDAPVSWDAQAEAWEVATTLEPLTGYYTVVDDPACLILLASIEDSMPTKQLSEGWNLIGPNPLFCRKGIDVGDAISPVARADGYAGFSLVISCGPNQPNWSYTLLDWRNGQSGKPMRTGKGYWVRMNSDEILSGVGFTPIGLYPD